MTIEELKQHCIKTIRISEAIESIPNVKITDNRGLQEHKMVLQLIEAWEKVKEEIKFIQEAEIQVYGKANWNFSGKCLDVIDKHLKEVEKNQRENCPYRHENGNCLVVGGFCTSVDDKYCKHLSEVSK